MAIFMGYVGFREGKGEWVVFIFPFHMKCGKSLQVASVPQSNLMAEDQQGICKESEVAFLGHLFISNMLY